MAGTVSRNQVESQLWIGQPHKFLDTTDALQLWIGQPHKFLDTTDALQLWILTARLSFGTRRCFQGACACMHIFVDRQWPKITSAKYSSHHNCSNQLFDHYTQ
ncbi:hypothetical protein PoB_000774500 [Plakobranchus ocellatus]|uniref:Uncharacterized protein n=1 Tax=Plakobranchus ocellatus TaxID=259542 RepID=A0AAV3YER0_9GAST|nr:hypothetical protein PoB_000774500 [Plakobranchus ocellatus]